MSGTHYKICLHISLVTMPELPCESYKINDLAVAMAHARTLYRILGSQFDGIDVKLWKLDNEDWVEIDMYTGKRENGVSQ